MHFGKLYDVDGIVHQLRRHFKFIILPKANIIDLNLHFNRPLKLHKIFVYDLRSIIYGRSLCL